MMAVPLHVLPPQVSLYVHALLSSHPEAVRHRQRPPTLVQ
jgi:hypothetical protein